MDDESAQLISCIPRLRRYARALVGNRAAADDLVQDTMERGWKKLASWQRGSDMRAWLFSIMHNLHIDQLRKSLPVVDGDEDMASDVPVFHHDALALRDMETALQQLSTEQREILLLAALEEMSYEEIAATLQIPVGTVMSRLSRARARLRFLMEGHPTASPLKVVK
jgi:RNA polymerase sigma factor (sigma-70 family)